MQNNEIISTNRMTATQLVRHQNAPLKFEENPHNGNIFFRCGEKVGYVSPAVRKVYETVTLEELQYAECSKNGEKPIPCLMMIGNSNKNTKRTLGEDLL